MAVNKCAFFACFFGMAALLAMYLIGFAAPYWYVYGDETHGLWQQCKVDLCTSLVDPNGSDKGAQAMCTIGVIVGLHGGIFFIVWMLGILQGISTEKGPYSVGRRVAGILIAIAGVFGVIGVMISGIKYKEETNRTPEGFAFWLIVAGAAGMIVLGPISIVLSRF